MMMNEFIGRELPKTELEDHVGLHPLHQSRHLWPAVETREAEWAISGAVIGLTAAVMQILTRSWEMKRRKLVERGDKRKTRFIDNYQEYWVRPRSMNKVEMAWDKKRKKATRKKRRKNNLKIKYVKNWDRAPVFIMDDDVFEQENSVMDEYIKHFISPLQPVPKPLKYDLKNLNVDFHTTTSDPWSDLKAPLPNSFSENMLSSLSLRNDKQSVELLEQEDLSTDSEVEKEQTVYNEESKIIKQNTMQTLYAPPINSYVGIPG